MQYLLRVGVILLSLMVLSCNKPLKQVDLPGSIQLGDRYFTQFVIRYEKGVHRTTNYRWGESIPINTEATLLEMTNQTILIKLLPSGQQLLINNIEKHTQNSITQAFEQLLNKSRVELSQFSTIERQNIDRGTVANGMRKQAVLAAIGYPPKIATANLDSQQWTYWSSRFNRFIVHFNQGRVVNIQD